VGSPLHVFAFKSNYSISAALGNCATMVLRLPIAWFTASKNMPIAD
jgi:hypothetical protein